MDANIFTRANQIIKTCDAAYFGVIDENGCPHVSTVSSIQPENIFTAYFSTGLNANKTKRLRVDKRAGICYRAGGDNISLTGEAEILTDPETKSRLWQDWFIEHFPGGKTDPNYCIIKFTAQRASLWVHNESAEFTIDELLSVQSRCGLLCKWCTFRASHNCGGCIETNGNPFHGECPVAKCCQEKEYTHCGECENLPGECAHPGCTKVNADGFFECEGCAGTSCGKLYPYSYKDPDHGDNPPGARVEVCKTWAANRNAT
jgi:general stress protein 26